jgi:hypothetical protein
MPSKNWIGSDASPLGEGPVVALEINVGKTKQNQQQTLKY